MGDKAALERELQLQLTSLQRKGRVYFGTYIRLPALTQAIVETIGARIHQTIACHNEGKITGEHGHTNKNYHTTPPKLEELGFCNCQFDQGGIQALRAFLRHTPSITSIIFTSVAGVTYDQIALLLQASTNLRMLKISVQLPPRESYALNPHHHHLSALSRRNHPDHSLTNLMPAAQSLEVLNLQGLEGYQMPDFSAGLSQLQNLRELHLCMTRASSDHVNGLLEALLNIQLDSLAMRVHPPSPYEFYCHGCLERLTKLLHQGVLRSLILSSLPALFTLPTDDTETLESFMSELRQNSSLHRLELGHSLGVDETVAVSIFRALETNDTLFRFSWNSCMLKNAWEGLISSLPRIQHLSEMTFSGIGEGTIALDSALKSRVMEALHQNMSLTNFRYERGFDIFATDRIDQLQELARRNSRLRRAKVAVKNATLSTGASHSLKVMIPGRMESEWQDSYWPLLLEKWGSDRSSCTAMYYIVQRRSIHWLENQHSIRMNSTRKRCRSAVEK